MFPDAMHAAILRQPGEGIAVTRAQRLGDDPEELAAELDAARARLGDLQGLFAVVRSLGDPRVNAGLVEAEELERRVIPALEARLQTVLDRQANRELVLARARAVVVHKQQQVALRQRRLQELKDAPPCELRDFDIERAKEALAQAKLELSNEQDKFAAVERADNG